MDLALILLIGFGTAIILAFVFCFFGYRWARFLLPICGLLVLEGIIYVFVYGLFSLGELETWLFFGGSSIAIYIILFFLKRIAGFFAGLLGSALLLSFIVYALNLQTLGFLVPICLTLCVITGILTIVYQRNAVIISTSIFGASAAVLLGLYFVFDVLIATAPIMQDNILAALESYLAANALLVAGCALGLAILGALIQNFSTGYKQVFADVKKEEDFTIQEVKQDTKKIEQKEQSLAPKKEKKSFKLERKEKNKEVKKADDDKSKEKKSFRLQR